MNCVACGTAFNETTRIPKLIVSCGHSICADCSQLHQDKDLQQSGVSPSPLIATNQYPPKQVSLLLTSKTSSTTSNPTILSAYTCPSCKSINSTTSFPTNHAILALLQRQPSELKVSPQPQKRNYQSQSLSGDPNHQRSTTFDKNESTSLNLVSPFSNQIQQFTSPSQLGQNLTNFSNSEVEQYQQSNNNSRIININHPSGITSNNANLQEKNERQCTTHIKKQLEAYSFLDKQLLCIECVISKQPSQFQNAQKDQIVTIERALELESNELTYYQEFLQKERDRIYSEISASSACLSTFESQANSCISQINQFYESISILIKVTAVCLTCTRQKEWQDLYEKEKSCFIESQKKQDFKQKTCLADIDSAYESSVRLLNSSRTNSVEYFLSQIAAFEQVKTQLNQFLKNSSTIQGESSEKLPILSSKFGKDFTINQEFNLFTQQILHKFSNNNKASITLLSPKNSVSTKPDFQFQNISIPTNNDTVEESDDRQSVSKLNKIKVGQPFLIEQSDKTSTSVSTHESSQQELPSNTMNFTPTTGSTNLSSINNKINPITLLLQNKKAPSPSTSQINFTSYKNARKHSKSLHVSTGQSTPLHLVLPSTQAVSTKHSQTQGNRLSPNVNSAAIGNNSLQQTEHQNGISNPIVTAATTNDTKIIGITLGKTPNNSSLRGFPIYTQSPSSTQQESLTSAAETIKQAQQSNQQQQHPQFQKRSNSATSKWSNQQPNQNLSGLNTHLTSNNNKHNQLTTQASALRAVIQSKEQQQPQMKFPLPPKNSQSQYAIGSKEKYVSTPSQITQQQQQIQQYQQVPLTPENPNNQNRKQWIQQQQQQNQQHVQIIEHSKNNDIQKPLQERSIIQDSMAESDKTIDYSCLANSVKCTLLCIGGRTSTDQKSKLQSNTPPLTVNIGLQFEKFDVATATWSRGSIAQSRNRIQFGIMLFKRNRVVIFGGKDETSNGRFSSFEEIDTVTNTSRVITGIKLSKPKSAFGFCQISEDEVMVAGGSDCNGAVLSEVEIYNLENNSIRSIGNLSISREELSLSISNDCQFVYAFGGYQPDQRKCLNVVEKYPLSGGTHYNNNSNSNSNVQAAWVKVTPMKEARRALQVVRLPDGFYVMGGFDGSKCLSSVEKFDDSTNQWNSVARMSTPRAAFTAVPSPNNFGIYVVSGFDSQPLRSAEQYSIFKGSWETLTNSSLPPVSKYMHCAVMLHYASLL